MQHNSPSSVSHRKNSFSNFVFQSTNRKFKRDFKSESFVDPATEKRKNLKRNSYTQTYFRSQSNLSVKSPRKVEIFRDNSTQTSKTAVAMVQTELDLRLSPDSLSPKPGPKKPSILDDSVINMMESVLTVKELGSLPYNRRNNVVQYLESCDEFQKRTLLTSGNTLTKAFLARIKNRQHQQHLNKQNSSDKPNPKVRRNNSACLKSRSCVESPIRNDSSNTTKIQPQPSRFTVKSVTEKLSAEDKTKPVRYYCRSKASNSIYTPTKTIRSTSFMSPTISSGQKDKGREMRSIGKLISPTRRGRSLSPKKTVVENLDVPDTKKVPYIDRSDHTLYSEQETKAKNKRNKLGYEAEKDVEDLHLTLTLSHDDMTNTTISITSSTSTECILFQAITKLRDQNWNTALRGLAEIVEICRVLDHDVIFPHMTVINQRLIELIRSSRSHVSRTACQAVGHLFEYVKDTRRPEFDELVDTLLCKTADSNKFIRHDANMALDCMVTHVATFHAIRSICSKGPDHKNPLVRTASARLIVCALVIAGPENVLHPHNNEYTRKRIIHNMVKFLNDKNQETRKFGQRLYKLLHKDRIFDIYLKRYLERDVIVRLKKCLKSPR